MKSSVAAESKSAAGGAAGGGACSMRGEAATAAVVASCRGVLEQCGSFLRGIDQASFVRPSVAMGGSSIGQHVRHALDHFSAALRWLEGGAVIDYDRRARATPVETERASAIEEVESLLGALEGVGGCGGDAVGDVGGESGGVMVRVMVASDGTMAELPSTLERELAFAAHHAIHHHAMVGAIAREFGLPVAAGFGKAPSTVEHECGRKG